MGTKTQIFFSAFSQIVSKKLQHLYSTQNSGPMYHSADDNTDIYICNVTIPDRQRVITWENLFIILY